MSIRFRCKTCGMIYKSKDMIDYGCPRCQMFGNDYQGQML